MLTTPRAIVLAAVLVVLAAFVHAMLPRYEVRISPNETGLIRMDRWTGTASLVVGSSGARPSWLQVER